MYLSIYYIVRFTETFSSEIEKRKINLKDSR